MKERLLKKLEKYITKQIDVSPNGTPYGDMVYAEWEDEETFDQYQMSINYDFKNKRFIGDVAVYHSGDDNNAENPDAHTDEYEYSSLKLEYLVETMEEDFSLKHIEEEIRRL